MYILTRNEEKKREIVGAYVVVRACITLFIYRKHHVWLTYYDIRSGAKKKKWKKYADD